MSTIKLKRSDVPGKIPLPSDLQDGELAFNTSDGVIYFKDVEGGVQGVGNVRNFQYTVGPNGQFPSLNSAVSFLSRLKPSFQEGQSATILLKSGFVLQEQLLLTNIDLGWISIESEDSTVVVDYDSVITEVEDESGETWRPVFFGSNATLPTIGCLFQMSEGSGFISNGLLLIKGSVGRISPGCGIENAKGRGAMLQGSSLFCRGASLYNSTRHNLYVESNSRVSGQNMNLSKDPNNTNSFGNVFAIYNCGLDLKGSTILNGRGDGTVIVRDASSACVRECQISSVEGHTVWSLRGSTIDLNKSSITTQDSSTSVFSQTASSIDATETTIVNSQGTLLLADDVSRLDGREATLTGDASAVVVSRKGSEINLWQTQVTGGGVGLFAEMGGRICANNSSSRDGTFGARVASGGEITAIDCDFSGNTQAGVRCVAGKMNISGTNCRKNGTTDQSSDIETYDGGFICASGSLGGTNIPLNSVQAQGIILK